MSDALDTRKRKKRAVSPAEAPSSASAPVPAPRKSRKKPTPAPPMTGYYLLDEGTPEVYTLYDTETNEEFVVDEGTNLSATVSRFLALGWEVYGAPWTYVCTAESGECASYHCQVVVSHEEGGPGTCRRRPRSERPPKPHRACPRAHSLCAVVPGEREPAPSDADGTERGLDPAEVLGTPRVVPGGEPTTSERRRPG